MFYLDVIEDLERKYMSCIVMAKSWVNLLTRLLIGCSLLCSQSGASLLANLASDWFFTLVQLIRSQHAC